MATTDMNIETHDEHHDHPSDRSYVMIAIILAVLTAIEVGMFFLEEAGYLPVRPNQIGLVALMVVKFWIVGSYFMHLKFDSKVLTWLFVSGLVLAIAVYFIMLSAFEFSFWNDGFEDPGLPDISS